MGFDPELVFPPATLRGTIRTPYSTSGLSVAVASSFAALRLVDPLGDAADFGDGLPTSFAEGTAVRGKQITDWLVFLLTRVFVCVLQSWRIETCHTFSRGMAILVCKVLRLRRGVVDENLQIGF